MYSLLSDYAHGTLQQLLEKRFNCVTNLLRPHLSLSRREAYSYLAASAFTKQFVRKKIAVLPLPEVSIRTNDSQGRPAFCLRHAFKQTQVQCNETYYD